MENRSVKGLDEIFPIRGSPSQGYKSSPSKRSDDARMVGARVDSSGGSGSGGSANNAARYAAQLKSCQVRYTILQNEHDEVAAEEEQLLRRKAKIQKGQIHM